MKLAEAAGVRMAASALVSSGNVAGVPERLLCGPSVLAVERFDRTEGGRIHIEDFAQLLGATGDQKYQRGNEESVVRAVQRFAGTGAAEEAIRRIVVNLLLGNTDAHLKNWSFIFPGGNRIALAPAYEIVSIHALDGNADMALRLRVTRDPTIIDVPRFQGFASWVGLTEAKMRRLVCRTVERAHDLWPEAVRTLPLSAARRTALDAWWRRLPLTAGKSSPFSR